MNRRTSIIKTKRSVTMTWTRGKNNLSVQIVYTMLFFKFSIQHSTQMIIIFDTKNKKTKNEIDFFLRYKHKVIKNQYF